MPGGWAARAFQVAGKVYTKAGGENPEVGMKSNSRSETYREVNRALNAK